MTPSGAGSSTSHGARRGRARYTARTFRNAFLDRWRGRDAELEASDAERATYRAAADRGDLAFAPVWVGEAVDLITDVMPAADLVARIAGEAESALIHAGSTMIRP